MTQDAQTAFLSYCREDSEFALRLAGDLKAAGASVWIDQLDITPGQRWDRAVEDALTKCPRMAVILSPASVNSTNVMDEVSFALEEQKTVIPVIYRDCAVPFRMRRVHYVDFRQDYARGLQELLKTLAPGQGEGQSGSAISDVGSQSQSDAPDAMLRRLAAFCVIFLLLGVGSERGISNAVTPPAVGWDWVYYTCASGVGLITGAIYAFAVFGRLPVARLHTFLLGGSWALGWVTMAPFGDPLAGILGGAFIPLLVFVRPRR